MRKLMPFVVFNTDDTPAATPPAPEPVAAAPAPPQPAPVGDGPWAQDLATLFPDEHVRAQVDTFLRGKVQPHVTQLEQQYAPARELWQDLQSEDPAQSLQTYLAVAEQLYGEEVAAAVAEQLQKQFTDAQQQPEPQAAPQQPTLTPEQQQAIDWAAAQQAEDLYQSELNRVKATVPEVQLNDQVFARYVVSSEGDFDAALTAYLAEQVPAAPPAPTPDPPTTLDDTGAPAAIPPTSPQNQTLDGALDDLLGEMRAAREAPATVGQV